MRSSFLIAFAAVAVVACSDERQQPTSPAVLPRPNAPIARATETSTGMVGVPVGPMSAAGKASVAFTKVFAVNSPGIVDVPYSYRAYVTATCPVGSYPISGTYNVINFLRSEHISQVESGPNASNGWTVTVRNTAPDFLPISVSSSVICVA